MAQVYHPKKNSVRLLEAAGAGLVGGVVMLLALVALDYSLSGGRWWLTPAVVGALVGGDVPGASRQFGAQFWLGCALLVLVFGLIGLGFNSYRPLLRRLNLSPPLAGAVYGLLMWLLLYFMFLNWFSPTAASSLNKLTLACAMALGGAALGWWLRRIERQPDTTARTVRS